MAWLPQLIAFLATRGQRQQEFQARQQQMDYMKSQKQLMDMGIKKNEQILETIKSLPEELQPLMLMNPEIGSLLVANSKIGMAGQEQPAGQAPFAQPTAEVGPPVGDVTRGPGLAGEIAGMQLGPMQNILPDIMRHKYGIGYSTEPVQTIPLPNPETGKMEMAQVLRSGGVRFLGYEPPTDVTYQLTKEPTTGKPIKVPMPTKVPPGIMLGLPQPVEPKARTITGPREEKLEQRYDPFTGQVISETPTGAAKPTAVPVSNQIQMVSSGFEALKKIKNAIFDPKTGKINRMNLANAMIGTPRTEGKRLGDLYGAALNAIRLASTGAAFSAEELRQLKGQYVANYTASDRQIRDQWQMMGNFLMGALQQLDPNQVWTKDKQGEFQELMKIPGGLSLQPTGKTKKYQIRKVK